MACPPKQRVMDLLAAVGEIRQEQGMVHLPFLFTLHAHHSEAGGPGAGVELDRDFLHGALLAPAILQANNEGHPPVHHRATARE